MKNKSSLLVHLLVMLMAFTFETVAQTKTFTMEDVVLASKKGLTPEKLDQLQWISKSNSYSFIRKIDTKEVLVSGTASGGENKDLLTLPQLNKAIRSSGYDSLTAFPEISWASPDRMIFTGSEKTLEYTLSTGVVKLLLDKPGKNAENKDLSPVYNALAYTIGSNLWVTTSEKRIPVAYDSIPGIVFGKLVHREEFGITKGTFWSPSGKMLAFYRMDERMVTDYPIIDLETQPAGVKMIKYPMAGGKSHQVTIGIYDLQTGKTVFLKTGEPAEQYLTNIAWNPDEKSILVAVLNRDQNHLQMNRYNVSTGAFESTLFEEKSDAYVQPLHPVIFNKSGTQFIWQSRRDGFNHLYLYESGGKLIKQLTKGRWEVTECLGYNAKEDRIGFVSNMESPINRDIYTVTIAKGDINKMSTGPGVHKAMMNQTGDYFIDEYSAPGIPRNINVVNAKGKNEKQLLSAPNPLKEFVPVKRKFSL